MFDKLTSVESRYDELMTKLGSVEVQSDPSEYKKAAKALAELEPLVQKFREFKGVELDIAGAEELFRSADTDMRELADEELKSLGARRESLLQELKILLVPKDPNDEKNVILEIRAGTGGDEAALFAGELFRMYTRYAERQGWKLDVMSSSETGGGGLKEAIVSIEGQGRLQPVEVRERRASRAARARDRSQRPHSHLDGDGRCSPGSRRSRHPD